MLTTILLCFVQCILGISCNFVSITAGQDKNLYDDFLNQTIGASVKSHCGTQRSIFDRNFEGPCNVYRWFYEPRTFQLTCVCVEHGEKFANGTLLQKSNQSFGIPAIKLARFAAPYELKIWTLSDPVQTARGLFSGATTNGVAVLHAGCRSIVNEINAYYCVTVHYYKDLVTWEYPENWSGPVRYLRNIAYKASETTVHFLGMYWPEKQHVDTVLLVEAGATEICERFLLSSIAKCRVEFQEETFGYKPSHLARLNLLMPADLVGVLTEEERVLSIAKRLKLIGQDCAFPVNIREPNASYVPSNANMNGKYFEFRVTFRRTVISWRRDRKTNTTVICQLLKDISGGLIQTCSEVEMHALHGFTTVLTVLTTTSVWEAQIRLMTRLNSIAERQCNFNVAVKPIFKGF